jgi:hypothetical protein
MSKAELLQEGYDLKLAIDRMTERLRQINKELESIADFGDKSTAHIVAGGIAVRIQRKENVKWDQGKIGQLADVMDGPTFAHLFKTEFKPDGKAISAYLRFGEHKEGVEWARTVTPGAPSVTYEVITEAQDAA